MRFESRCLSAAEEFVAAHYSRTRISGKGPDPVTRIERRVAPLISVDTCEFRYSHTFGAEEFGLFCLLSLHRGSLTMRRGGDADAYGPGNVMLLGHPGQALRGSGVENSQTAVLLHPSVINRVAGIDEDARCPVRGFRPVSRAAEDRLATAISYVARMAESDALGSGLVSRTATEHLAALVLDCFPHDLRTGLSVPEGRSVHGGTWQRAARFIEENAHRDIGIADIAAAAGVTPRAVQYAFARYAGTTPLDQLRTARLSRAHAELAAADPALTSVARIALTWGFSHPGRFSALYRRAYGVSPSVTLRRP
ncbi:helix-turn-helix domain-containing protein [Streptomyces sp. NPDC090085]|uniref:helix-turn-helix domain-containing protein n=1 Tax=Streptomyces sp. NPDC090085 TaxID=3365943 RepID=UPI00382F5E32